MWSSNEGPKQVLQEQEHGQLEQDSVASHGAERGQTLTVVRGLDETIGTAGAALRRRPLEAWAQGQSRTRPSVPPLVSPAAAPRFAPVPRSTRH